MSYRGNCGYHDLNNHSNQLNPNNQRYIPRSRLHRKNSNFSGVCLSHLLISAIFLIGLSFRIKCEFFNK